MKDFIVWTGFVFCVLLSQAGHAKNSTLIIPEGKPYNIKKDDKKDIKTTVQNVGWVENVCIGDLELKLKAKLDTGASVSSVNADIIKIVKRGDKSFVFYRIVDGDLKSDVIEAQLTRYTLIKPKMEDTGDKIRRPVVMTEFRIGNNTIREEVNLANRDHFAYPLLIGRNVLRNNFAVDSSKTFATKTQCSKK
jgi:hypothetical protein